MVSALESYLVFGLCEDLTVKAVSDWSGLSLADAVALEAEESINYQGMAIYRANSFSGVNRNEVLSVIANNLVPKDIAKAFVVCTNNFEPFCFYNDNLVAAAKAASLNETQYLGHGWQVVTWRQYLDAKQGADMKPHKNNLEYSELLAKHGIAGWEGRKALFENAGLEFSRGAINAFSLNHNNDKYRVLPKFALEAIKKHLEENHANT